MSSTCTQQQPLLVVTDTPIIKATMPVIPPRVRIIYEDYDDVSVQYELKAFSLKDFDYFVRQRFQIEEGTALKYSQDLEGKCESRQGCAFYASTACSPRGGWVGPC